MYTIEGNLIRENSKIIITLFLAIVFLSPLYGGNTVTFLPEPGLIQYDTLCTLEVESQIPADSVTFSIEYRSQRGMIRKKSIGTITNPPFRMIFSTKELKNQYFFGANAIAEVYRKDDTLQIINAPRLFFIPDQPKIDSHPLYPTEYTNAPHISFYGDTLSSVSITKSEKGLSISVIISKESGNVKGSDGITVVLDPLLKRTPFPGNEAVILYVPVQGEPQLITSSENRQSEDYIISRTGTKITLDNSYFQRGSSTLFTVEIPDFLLGGSVPDSLGVNVIVPVEHEGTFKHLSLIDGEEFMLYSPILFPTLNYTIPPVEKKSPYPVFLISFAVGFFLMAIIFIIRRTPPTKEDIKPAENELLSFIESEITNPDLSIELIASKLKRLPNAINRECAKLTGKKISAYIQWLRIEIVKERLVSSNASEISIAKECGFKTVAEMEDGFHHLTGIAPYQFREKNGIK